MPSDEEINRLLNPKYMRNLLNKVKENDITYKQHFLVRLQERSEEKDFIPTNTKEFKKMIINRYPVHVIYENEDAKFRVYYNMNEEYDLIVILAIMHIRKPVRIRFIPLYPQAVDERV